MGMLVQFEERAVARLRERLGAAEQANEALLAFAHGHSGAVAAIHRAVLAAMEAEDFDSCMAAVTVDWPDMLEIDAVSVALIVGDRGFRISVEGIESVDPAFIRAVAAQAGSIQLKSVRRGHPLFGAPARSIRAQALLPIDCGPGLPSGVLLLGQGHPLDLDDPHGLELLMFLAHSLAAMIRGWLTRP